MMKKGKANGSFSGNFLNQQILSPKPYFLKDPSQVVDFRFVREHCKDSYAEWVRDAWDPHIIQPQAFLPRTCRSLTQQVMAAGGDG
ncbi:MAG: hypothetical protein Q7O12_13295 [Deltaproteobacteria bacterium]|nr:hypothetical protein [Deltaproteobacteria bacterium]